MAMFEYRRVCQQKTWSLLIEPPHIKPHVSVAGDQEKTENIIILCMMYDVTTPKSQWQYSQRKNNTSSSKQRFRRTSFLRSGKL